MNNENQVQCSPITCICDKLMTVCFQYGTGRLRNIILTRTWISIYGKIASIFLLHISHFFTYFGFKLVKDKYKWHSIGFVVSVVISLVFASSFSHISTGVWFLVVIISTVAILFSSLFIIVILKHYLIIKYVHKKVIQLKDLPPTDMVEYLVKDHNKKHWYVLYFPESNSIEIGVNLFGSDLVIGKKLHIKTLTDRMMYFIPGNTSQDINLKNSMIYNLQDFYNINSQTRALVESYISKVKGVHKENMPSK